MCGIVGTLDTTGKRERGLGRTLLQMLKALGCRGPDSSGVAAFGRPQKRRLMARVKLSDGAPFDGQLKRLKSALKAKVSERCGEVVKLEFANSKEAEALVKTIEGVASGVEVLSLGRSLDLVKQVGLPDLLEQKYRVTQFAGRVGIGHTRLSTESRVDLSHSQPFWAHGTFDLATVHNGHITNYHKLRRIYEQQGVRFYTENDSELIGIYLGDQIRRGLSLREALEKSMKELDGSFCTLVATPDTLACIKDPFAFKPLVVGEGDGVVAVATEEVAIRKVFPDLKIVREPDARSIRIWTIHADD